MKIGTLIFLLVIVWQIVSAIVGQAERKKKQEEQMELAAKRRMGGQPIASPSRTAAGPVGKQPGLASRMQSRAEELAARRQAQLEELRKRRAGNRTPARGVTQVRAGTPTAMAPTPSPVMLPQQRSRKITSQSADIESIHRQQEIDARAKKEALRQRRQQSKIVDEAQARAKAAEEARVRAEREQLRRKAEAGLGQLDKDVHPISTDSFAQRNQVPGVNRSDLIEKLHRRNSLRELFLLKELLDPPLAFRAPEQ